MQIPTQTSIRAVVGKCRGTTVPLLPWKDLNRIDCMGFRPSFPLYSGVVYGSSRSLDAWAGCRIAVNKLYIMYD